MADDTTGKNVPLNTVKTVVLCKLKPVKKHPANEAAEKAIVEWATRHLVGTR